MSNSSWLNNNGFVQDKPQLNVKSRYLKSISDNVANNEKYSLSCFNLCLENVNGNTFSTNNECARKCSQKVEEIKKNFYVESYKGLDISKEFL
jgi:hypothetical protein